ncbi:hypothetical protein E4U53_007795 [Claviceps sorghi]|nr:hypothetical protein E4U53_007795 [Claviceps sorghi]
MRKVSPIPPRPNHAKAASPHTHDVKAIIIGGGPAGISAALRLHQTTDISATVYELHAEPRTLGGAVATAPNGMRLFHRLGVHDELVSRGSSCATITIRSLRSGVLASYDSAAGVKERNGGFGPLRIKRIELVRVLLAAAEKANIPIHYGKKLVAVQESADGVKVTFEDGSTDEADLVLGCDGIHSAVRRQYVDAEQEPEYSGLSGIGAIIPRPKDLPASMASQLRGTNGTLTTAGALGVVCCAAQGEELFWGMSKEVALPADGDTRDGWELTRADEVADFRKNALQMLGPARNPWADTVRVLVAETHSVGFYPVYKLPPGRSWHRGRCVLVGDAAHAMQPHAGQGVSQALEDIFLLARLLRDPSRPLPDAFAAYDRIRRPRVEEIAGRAASAGRMRRATGPWGLWLKEWLIWAYFAGSGVFGYRTTSAADAEALYDVDEEDI